EVAKIGRLNGGLLNERSRRRWAAAEARSEGRGGWRGGARAPRIADSIVRRGLREHDVPEQFAPEHSPRNASQRRNTPGRPGERSPACRGERHQDIRRGSELSSVSRSDVHSYTVTTGEE